VKTRIVQIGNSRGIRLPKVLLEEAQLADVVELEAEPGRIVIRKGNRPRAGWAEAARRMRERNDDRLLDPTTPTRFDEREWKWRRA
jgi:antitoxin MazE